MRQSSQMRVEARRIDDQEVGLAFNLDDRLTEQVELELLVLLDRIRARQWQVIMGGVRDLQFARLRPVAPVFHILGEGLLAAIDVNRSNAESLVEQVDREV